MAMALEIPQWEVPTQSCVWQWGAVTSSPAERSLDDSADLQSYWMRAVPGLSAKVISHISCGEHHVLVTTASGGVWGWGSNTHGQLGCGDYRPRDAHFPALMSGALRNRHALFVACGAFHSMILCEDGSLCSCGLNNFSQLGLIEDTDICVPSLVDRLAHLTIKLVSCGHSFTVALTDELEVLAWGANAQGQLGFNSYQSKAPPGRVVAAERCEVFRVSCGAFHCVALTKGGEVLSWGCNARGQLGVGDRDLRRSPVLVTGTAWSGRKEMVGAEHVACGAEHSIVVCGNGTVWAWGAGNQGQLGNQTSADMPLPCLVEGLVPSAHCTARVPFCGGDNSGMVTSLTLVGALCSDGDGGLFAWGNPTLLSPDSRDDFAEPSPQHTLGWERALQVGWGREFGVAARLRRRLPWELERILWIGHSHGMQTQGHEPSAVSLVEGGLTTTSGDGPRTARDGIPRKLCSLRLLGAELVERIIQASHTSNFLVCSCCYDTVELQ